MTGYLTRAGLTRLAPAGVGCAAVADDGAVAYTTPDGVTLTTGAAALPVVRLRGGPFRSVGGLDLADDGLLVFQAGLRRGGEGIFLRTATGTDPLAVTGDPSPAGVPYVSFGRPTVTTAGGGWAVAFRAVLGDGRVCVVQQVGNRRPVITLVSGQSLPDGTVADLSPSRLGHALCCVVRMAGGAATAVIVNGGVVAAGDWLRDGAGGVARILDPPAISAQLGFVTVEREDGGRALWTRPPGVVDPQVVVATGDPAPGLESGTVLRIGAPVASNCAALRVPFGVAAGIELTDGRFALWLGVFTGQVPLTGLATVPAVSGARTDDGHRLAGPLVPLSLSNTGILLFRAGDALLRLDGLFDGGVS
ncbi:hypothetical protein [Actinophytocola sp.]|uniref:hypothetical protein n=1 Tax=Actinophytocola sp. TaxID=1872138 RepID=UPI002D80C6BA|nr:hypothetical protein [Actinophytocola sp.]HET9137791.1 hypothetical protein [Actinophytocola sp.]